MSPWNSATGRFRVKIRLRNVVNALRPSGVAEMTDRCDECQPVTPAEDLELDATAFATISEVSSGQVFDPISVREVPDASCMSSVLSSSKAAWSTSVIPSSDNRRLVALEISPVVLMVVIALRVAESGLGTELPRCLDSSVCTTCMYSLVKAGNSPLKNIRMRSATILAVESLFLSALRTGMENSMRGRQKMSIQTGARLSALTPGLFKQ